MKEITREYYVSRVGNEPLQDDLGRCNCPEKGVLHRFCGWCELCDKPRFICGHPNVTEVRKDSE